MTSRREGPLVRVEVDPSTVIDVFERHRARLLGALEGLDAPAWAAPSRCTAWSVADVVAHLRWGTGVGLELIRRVEAGSGNRVFAAFDPNVTPEAELAPLRGIDPAEHLSAIRTGTASILATARDLAARGVEVEADTPLGWVPWPLAVNHILWDSWLHERDVLLPLGRAADPDPVEVHLVGSYQLVILGAVLSRFGASATVDLRLEGACGEAQRLRVGDEVAVDHPAEPPGEEGCIRGDAVAVIEAMSGRGDLASLARGPDAMLTVASLLGRRLAGM
ncbi:MAG TPA: maleylpyruvate isomerase family mycothiol-dependent enzyme [Candidatus Dormibacteraeota bacterium]